MDNKHSLDSLIKNLDNESKNVVESILKDAEYISTHNFVDLLRDLLNKEELISKHFERLNSYRHLKLYANLHEQSVFD